MPSIAQELRLKRQTRTILAHLKSYDSISPVEALVSHGISRLAPAIYELRQAGYSITTNMKRDAVGHHYARYIIDKDKSK